IQESSTMRRYEAKGFMDFGFSLTGRSAGDRTGNGVSHPPEIVGCPDLVDGRSYGLCYRTKLRTQSDDRLSVDGQSLVHPGHQNQTRGVVAQDRKSVSEPDEVECRKIFEHR